MDDDDPQPEILAALQRLEFMCGAFEGQRRFWYHWGEAGPWEAIELETNWVLDGLYLYETSPHPHQHCYWGYDCYAKQYRQWVFGIYGHFFWGFPNPHNWSGVFEGDSLVMTYDYPCSLPIEYATDGLGKFRQQFLSKRVYTPGPEGTFTVIHHRKKRSYDKSESFPGYFQEAEYVYQRRPARNTESGA